MFASQGKNNHKTGNYMTLPVKNATVCALIASTLLLGACSSSSDDPNQWVTDAIYNGDDKVSKPQVALASNGDVLVIWQEHEQNTPTLDTALNDAHDPNIPYGVGDIPLTRDEFLDPRYDSGAPQYDPTYDPYAAAKQKDYGQHSDLDHAYVCERTNLWIRRYDAASSSWGTASILQTGKWRKAMTVLVDSNNSIDHVEESMHNTLQSGATIAVDGSGNALAMWNQSENDDCNLVPSANTQPVLYTASYDVSTHTWSTPAKVQVNGKDARAVHNIQIKLNSTGAGLVAWEQLLDDSASIGAQNLAAIYAASYSSATLGTPVLINDSTSSNGYTLYALASQPALAVNTSGNGVIAWRHLPRKTAVSDEPASEIRVKRYTATGDTWGSSLTLATATSRTANYTAASSVETPAIALNDSGQIWGAWIDDSHVDNASGAVSSKLRHAKANSISATNTIGSAHVLQNDDTSTADDETLYLQYSVSIALTSSNKVMATWTHRYVHTNVGGLYNDWNNSTNFILRAATFDGTSWSNANSIDAGDRPGLDAFAPKLANLNTDQIVLAWTQVNDPRTDSHYAVNVRNYSFSNGWSATETVGTSKDPYSLQLDANGQGNASVVWYSEGNVASASLQ